MLKKLFLYIFYPKWRVYKATTVNFRTFYSYAGMRLPNSDKDESLILYIMYSENRNKYKLVVHSGVDYNEASLLKLDEYVKFTKEVYTLNHSK